MIFIENSFKIAIVIVILAIIGISFYLYFMTSTPIVTVEFAKCLTIKNATFYGSYQCSHCTEQKQLFGDTMQYINYVECGPLGAPPTNQACIQAGIESYPTWIINNTKYVGFRQLSELSQITGCSLS